MVAEAQNSKAHRHDLHGSACGAEADLKVTGLMTVNWAGIGGAKGKVGSGSSAQNHVSCGAHSCSGGLGHLLSGLF